MCYQDSYSCLLYTSGGNQNRNRSVENDGGSREQRRDIPSENQPSNDQGTHIARVNYIMADERNNQEDHRGNRKPNPNSGNAEGRNRRNEEDIDPYVYCLLFTSGNY